MAGSTIGSKVTTGVTLGSTSGPGIYLSPLTVTPTGDIAPSNYGVSGLSASISLGYVLNQGAISGGIGIQGAPGSSGGAGGGGVALSAGSLINIGTVTGGSGGGGTGGGDGGHGGYGIDLAAALFTNSGTITGGDGGRGQFNHVIFGDGGAGGTGAILASGILLNGDTISGGIGGAGAAGGAGGIGLILDGGSLSNQGIIIGGQPGHGSLGDQYQNLGGGVGAAIYAGSLTNTGTISGWITPSIGAAGGADGLVITGGNVLNHGTINGGDGGARVDYAGPPGGDGVTLAAGSLTNDGMISGGRGGSGREREGVAGAGVTISGGELTNHGTIAGGTEEDIRAVAGIGVDVFAGSLINDGTITGGRILYGQSGGGVYFHNGGTLTNDGIISSSANPFVPVVTADAVNFGNGASRLILGNDAVFFGAVVANAAYNNVLELTSGSDAGIITGLGDTIGGFQTVTVDPGASWFISGNTAGLAAGQTIDGFTVHDTIELTSITATGSNYAAGVLTLASAGGPLMLDLPGDFTTGDIIVNNAAAGTDITVVCFRAGTRIRITGGTKPVEELCIGEPVLVLAPDGRLVPRPIIWIGHRSVDCRHHPNPHLVWPVRIRAGTFGPDAPCRDLFLSPDHAVFVDSVLIPVKYLINGDSIEQVPMDEVVYFHIEMQTHSVLLAEDLTTESYLDTGDRTKFSSGAKQSTLFPDFATRVWEAAGCASLVVIGTTLDAVRQRINGGRQQRRHPTWAGPPCDPDKKPMHIWNEFNQPSPNRSEPMRAREPQRA